MRESLVDPSIQDEALVILRGLVERVVAKCGPEGWEIEVPGESWRRWHWAHKR